LWAVVLLSGICPRDNALSVRIKINVGPVLLQIAAGLTFYFAELPLTVMSVKGIVVLHLGRTLDPSAVCEVGDGYGLGTHGY